MERIRQSFKQALSQTGLYLILFSSVVTIVGIIGYDNFIDNYVHRILFVASIFAMAYFVAVIRCYFKQSIDIDLDNNRSVCIEYSDLFSKQGVVVIPFNQFFDTIVDGKILNETSIAGQLVKNKYAGNLNALDIGIAETTSKLNHIFTSEKEGKKFAYPIGTVAKVQQGANDYYCVALTGVDDDYRPTCDIEKLHIAIIEVLKLIDKEANGKDVYMPVLGSGLSGLNRDKQAILKYLIYTLKASSIPIRTKLHIVLYEGDRKHFNLSNLQ